MAAAVVLLDSVDSAAAVLVPVAPVLVVQVPLLVVADLPLHPLLLLLPRVVVGSEVALHLQGRQSFSAAMARISPPTVKPTYERAPSTR